MHMYIYIQNHTFIFFFGGGGGAGFNSLYDLHVASLPLCSEFLQAVSPVLLNSGGLLFPQNRARFYSSRLLLISILACSPPSFSVHVFPLWVLALHIHRLSWLKINYSSLSSKAIFTHKNQI
jgi:hypothetical protein